MNEIKHSIVKIEIDIVDDDNSKTKQSNLLEEEKKYNGILLLLSITTIFGMSTWFSASAVIPALRMKWNVSNLAISILTLSVNTGFLIGALLSIHFDIADYYKPSKLMACGSILSAAFNLILIFPNVHLVVAIVSRLLTGAAMAIVYPMASKVCCTWFLKRRGLAMGVIIASVTFGAAAPSLINGTIKLHWQLVVITTSILSLIGGIMSACFLNEGPLYVSKKENFNNVIDSSINNNKKNNNNDVNNNKMDDMNKNNKIWVDVIKNKAFVLGTLSYSGHNWEIYALWTWFTSFAYDKGVGQMLILNELDASNGASLASFFVIAVGVIGSIAGGILADEYGRTTICIISLCFSILCSLIVAWLNASPAILLFFGILWGNFTVSESAQYSSMVTEVVKPENIGTASTLQFAIGYVFTIPSMYVVPYFKSIAGWGVAWTSLTIGPVIALIGVYLLRFHPLSIAAKNKVGRKVF